VRTVIIRDVELVERFEEGRLVWAAATEASELQGLLLGRDAHPYLSLKATRSSRVTALVLSAIATFQGADLAETMPNRPQKRCHRSKGATVDKATWKYSKQKILA
jgi:hypothetical protein